MSRVSKLQTVRMTSILLFVLLHAACISLPSKDVYATSTSYFFVFVNGKSFSSTVGEAVPYISPSGRLMVPVRMLTMLGTSIDDINQNFKDGSVHIDKPTQKLRLKIGDQRLYVNGKTIVMDSVPAQVRTSIFVPLRALAESLGANVHYDSAKKFINVSLTI